MLHRVARPLVAAALLSVALVGFSGAGAPAAKAEDPLFIDWNTALPSLVDEFDPGSADDCIAGRSNCVILTLNVMKQYFRPLATSCAHHAPFSLAYLRITQGYEYVRDSDYQDVPWMNYMDAVFAGMYLGAYDNWTKGNLVAVPEPWVIAFEASKNKQVTGSGDLLLGINAHVNRDIPFMLESVGLVAPDGTSRKMDFDKVNELLSEMTPPMNAEFGARFDPTMDGTPDLPLGLGYTSLYQAMASWRERAWRNAEALVSAPTAADRELVAQRIEADAVSEAYLILGSTAYMPPFTTTTSRDAWCSVHYADPPPEPYPWGTPSAF